MNDVGLLNVLKNKVTWNMNYSNRVNPIFKSLAGVYLLLLAFNANAFTQLTIAGEYAPPGISGTFPDDASFSWIKHKFSPTHDYFSWRIGGGVDGGIIFNQPQSYGDLTAEFMMFSQPTGFYSVNEGITINPDNTIDMSNIRMSQFGEIIDIGSGSGYDTMVPYVDDFLSIAEGSSGWSITDSGVYHLFYTTRGTCLECELTIHLTGTAIVPLPAAVWLMISGLLSLPVISRITRKKKA